MNLNLILEYFWRSSVFVFIIFLHSRVNISFITVEGKNRSRILIDPQITQCFFFKSSCFHLRYFNLYLKPFKILKLRQNIMENIYLLTLLNISNLLLSFLLPDCQKKLRNCYSNPGTRFMCLVDLLLPKGSQSSFFQS